MHVTRFVAVVAPLATIFPLVGCAPSEPPNWPQGGAPLAIASARWDRGSDDPVEIRPNGQVFEGSDLLFVVDRVGRTVDEDYDPLAILLPDGRLIGTDSHRLGQVGVTNAAPPWSAQAWLAVMPDGVVTYFSPEGDREHLGRWQGCNGPALRTCTLVTHLVALRQFRAPPESGVSVGIGVGIGL